jgi:hypothetical protein
LKKFAWRCLLERILELSSIRRKYFPHWYQQPFREVRLKQRVAEFDPNRARAFMSRFTTFASSMSQSEGSLTPSFPSFDVSPVLAGLMLTISTDHDTAQPFGRQQN